MKLTPLDPKDPILRERADEVTSAELKSAKFQVQIDDLLGFVFAGNDKKVAQAQKRPITVGLSANQVGIPKRISIVDMAIGHKGFSDVHVLINPEIIKHGKATFTHSEGCVNLHGIWGPVERYKTITVRALDRSGSQLTIKATGWVAVLLQHEIDHLDGKLFIDHLKDPRMAHAVADAQVREYNKKTAADWPHKIDVTDLVRG